MKTPAPSADLVRDAFLARLDTPIVGEALFDRLPDLVYFIKNERAEYLVVNQTLVERCGRRSKSDLLGKRADELFPPPLGETYRAQDRLVLERGVTLLDQLELHLYPTGRRGWCLTTKLPLRNRAGRIAGLVGISKDLQTPDEQGEDYSAVAAALRHLHANLGEPLRVRDLSRLARLSPFQFERRVRAIFRLTTGQLIQKSRIDAALRMLRDTECSVAEIAHACGYSDQSAFTRTFHRLVGLSPTRYRASAYPEPKSGFRSPLS